MDGPTRAANIKFALVDGAADSATAGLDVEAKDGTTLAYGDQLIAVVELVTSDNTPTDRTATSSINSSDKLLVANSENDKIAVWWMACTADADQMSSPMIEADLVEGALANTNMATTGIKTGDSLICAVEIATTTGAWTDRTDTTSITSDGNVQCTAATTDDTMLLMWHAKDNVTAEASMYLRFTLASMGLSDESDITVTGIKTEDQVLACYATDETSALGLDEVSAEVTITEDDTIRVDQVSPTVTAGADLWVFWVDRELVS